MIEVLSFMQSLQEEDPKVFERENPFPFHRILKSIKFLIEVGLGFCQNVEQNGKQKNQNLCHVLPF